MPTATMSWDWTDAFCKFGFGDGDSPNFTDLVAEKLGDLGFKVSCDSWGIHNYMIMELITPAGDDLFKDATVGYDDPRSYLPKNIVALLDRAFPS